jgi:hypothetical protein
MSENPTEKAWKRIFEALPMKEQLDKTGIARIAAAQIKQITGREPRLMTKFDSRKSRPKTLTGANVTILPISNGEYALLRGDGYCEIKPPNAIQAYPTGELSRLQTISLSGGIRGESQVIDTLFMVSALRTFVGDNSLRLTIRGRLRSSQFSYKFITQTSVHSISVDRVQIEVDSGYEGKKIALVEAKFGRVNDFIIRQLYYPYRDLLARGISKEIIPILLVYSNRVYSLYSFAFQKEDEYNSIVPVGQIHYSLDEPKAPPSMADFVSPRRRIPPQGIPFPQANDLSRVFDVAELLGHGPANKFQIARRFPVDPRQGDYYGNAVAWLGLAEKSGATFTLTALGRSFNKMPRTDRIAELGKILGQMPAFAEAIEARAQGTDLKTNEISEIVARDYRLSQTSTGPRRANTVQSWINALAKYIEQ